MNSYTVDASVAIKWFIAEPLQTNAWTLAKQPENLIAPDFFLVEMTSIVWKKVVRGEITESAATDIIRHVAQGVRKLLPAEALAHRALAIGLELNHSTYDCMYMAVAETTGFALVSADMNLVRAAKGTRWQSLIVPLSSIPPWTPEA